MIYSIFFCLIVPSLPSLLRWELCRCSVQIQRQHILQWSAACSNARCEYVQVLCNLGPSICPSRIHSHFPTFIALIFLFRVFSLRTKRSSSTTPFSLFYPKRLSYQLLTLSWRAIFRLFDGWWPRRLASRLLPSCLSKTAEVILLLPPAFIYLKYILGRAAGNRHALSFQGLVKGLEAQMQRKYESIHLSVPFCLFLILLVLFRSLS